MVVTSRGAHLLRGQSTILLDLPKIKKSVLFSHSLVVTFVKSPWSHRQGTPIDAIKMSHKHKKSDPTIAAPPAEEKHGYEFFGP